MAIVKSLGLGKARGSAGEFTYTTIQGRTIARTKPAHVENPNTPLQQAQRLRMANVVLAWRMVGVRLQKLWTNKPKYNSPYNAFVGANIMHMNTFEVSEKRDEVYLKDGFILGKGQYHENTFEGNLDSGTFTAVLDKNSPLMANAKEGDIVGVVFIWQNGNIAEICEQNFEDGVVDNSTSDLVFSFDDVSVGVTSYAVYFYSPSRKLSSTCVVKSA